MLPGIIVRILLVLSQVYGEPICPLLESGTSNKIVTPFFE